MIINLYYGMGFIRYKSAQIPIAMSSVTGIVSPHDNRISLMVFLFIRKCFTTLFPTIAKISSAVPEMGAPKVVVTSIMTDTLV